MGAKHGGSLGSKIQKVEDAGNSISREQSKVDVVQKKPPLRSQNVGGRGLSAIGTVYPINAPIDDRGTISVASIDIAMAGPKHHYIKISLNNTDPTINFTKLIVGLTSSFTLDLTNSIALSSLTFVPALSNSPTIDLTNGARNILYIVGHRTSSETRYQVVGGGAAGVGGFLRTLLNILLPPVIIEPINWTRIVTADVTQV